MDCGENSGGVGKRGTSETARTALRGTDVDEVIVPKSQVKNFMDTLRTFSDSCCASHKGVREAVVNTKKAADTVEAAKNRIKKDAATIHDECEQIGKITDERMTEMKAMDKTMQDALRDM